MGYRDFLFSKGCFEKTFAQPISAIVKLFCTGPLESLDGIQNWQRNIVLVRRYTKTRVSRLFGSRMLILRMTSQWKDCLQDAHSSNGDLVSYLLFLCLQNHTNNAELGQIFAATKPRLAIATHLVNNPHTYIPIITSIRSTYPVGQASGFYAPWIQSSKTHLRSRRQKLCFEWQSFNGFFVLRLCLLLIQKGIQTPTWNDDCKAPTLLLLSMQIQMSAVNHPPDLNMNQSQFIASV